MANMNLQHADNPVDWYPWGDTAFELAKSQNKPILFSIVYAACHWCHVMEYESFKVVITADENNFPDFLSASLFAGKSTKEDKPTAYVCHNFSSN